MKKYKTILTIFLLSSLVLLTCYSTAPALLLKEPIGLKQSVSMGFLFFNHTNIENDILTREEVIEAGIVDTAEVSASGATDGYNDNFHVQNRLSSGLFNEKSGSLAASFEIFGMMGTAGQGVWIDWIHSLSLNEVNVYEMLTGSTSGLLQHNHNQYSGNGSELSTALWPVPEPATMLLLGMGLLGIASVRKGRKN